jgi:hypothetical protein
MSAAAGSAGMITSIAGGYSAYQEGKANQKILKAEAGLIERSANANEAAMRKEIRRDVGKSEAILGASGIASRSRSADAYIEDVIRTGEVDIEYMRMGSYLEAMNKRFDAVYSSINGRIQLAQAFGQAGGQLAQMGGSSYSGSGGAGAAVKTKSPGLQYQRGPVEYRTGR